MYGYVYGCTDTRTDVRIRVRMDGECPLYGIVCVQAALTDHLTERVAENTPCGLRNPLTRNLENLVKSMIDVRLPPGEPPAEPGQLLAAHHRARQMTP
jgi:hypothetical protein